MPNHNLRRLIALSEKQERRILGLMSGTSLDGVDLALCTVSGQGLDTKLAIGVFDTRPFAEAFRNELLKVTSVAKVDFAALTKMNRDLGVYLANEINEFLERHDIDPASVDAIASHGQTVFHAPGDGKETQAATFQVGDGDHIAHQTGILTLSDFRQKHIAAGGEGAPLTAYGDYLLCSKEGVHRILLNVGGMANITYLPPDLDPDKVFSTDTGPGNRLIDLAVRKFFHNKPFDKAGKIARSGQFLPEVYKVWMSEPFFEAPLPKTTGAELFGPAFFEKGMAKIDEVFFSREDVVRTVSQLTVDTIADAMKKVLPEDDEVPTEIYVSGGGFHNRIIMEQLEEKLSPHQFGQMSDLGIDPDAKEAALFALLANETLFGEGLVSGRDSGVKGKITLGKVSFPF